MRQSLSSPPTLKHEIIWPSSEVSRKLENLRLAVTGRGGGGGVVDGGGGGGGVGGGDGDGVTSGGGGGASGGDISLQTSHSIFIIHPQW